MARKLRYEAAGAAYHVMNRGNYRAPIFATDGAKAAFLKCLDQACQKTGWAISAWAIMKNHYHLSVVTPEPNLVDGIQWLESTFAARFNRFRDEHGHLFQGRYKAIPVEPGDHLGRVCNYIVLNPIRASLIGADLLPQWPWTSFRWLYHPKHRREWFDPIPALASAGGLSDTKLGRGLYRRYLSWLAEDDAEQRRLGFEGMCTGWAFGSEDFKREILTPGDGSDGMQIGYGSGESAAARAFSWTIELERLKTKIPAGKMTDQKKSADWKVALATAMKVGTTATNRWLSEQLNMGALFAVSRLTSDCQRGLRAEKLYRLLTR